MLNPTRVLFIVCCLLLLCNQGEFAPVPTPEQLQWSQYEVAAMISFNMWVFCTNMSANNVPPVDAFNPTKLNTDSWLYAASLFGAKYAVLTAKHSSGFCLFPSEYPGYEYSVLHTKWGNGQRDIVAEFIASCKKYNIRPAFYYSFVNNYYQGVQNSQFFGNTTNQKAYNDLVIFQATELWTKYGDLAEIWFDGGVTPVDQGGPDIIPLIKKYQPNAMVFNSPAGYKQCIRWIGNEDGDAPDPNWSTCETDICVNGGSGNPDGPTWCPAEVDTPLRGNGRHDWFWLPDGGLYVKTLDQLVTEYMQSTGRNGNYLLNINPNNYGLIDQVDLDRYAEFGLALSILNDSSAIVSTSGSGEKVDLYFDQPTYVDHVILQEQQSLGQRVRLYDVIGKTSDSTWVHLANGTSIGNKKIDAIVPTEVVQLKFVALDYTSTPLIKRFAAYFLGPFP